MPETLEDHLRRATRNFTAPLPEERVLTLGLELARELVRAHAETPPRHPEMDPARIPMVDGCPRLPGGTPEGSVGEDLFCLGALLCALASGTPPEVSWRLDGPPPPDMSTLGRRDVLSALASPGPDARLASAQAAASALEAALAPAFEASAPWPLFRGDPARSGCAAGTEAARFSPLWKAAVGAVIASPVLTRSFAIAPVSDGRLVFLDRRTGRRVHQVRLGSAVESSPALSSGMLHVGTDDGEVVGVGLVDGVVRYRVKLGEMVRSSPLPLAEGVVVGVVDGKDAGSAVAVDASGKPLWRRKLGAVFSSPALGGGYLLVGSDDGRLHALDPAKGTAVWSQELGAKVRATPAVRGEIAVVGDFGGRLAAVSVKDGTPVWSLALGHPLYSSPCLSADLCVVGCHEGHVHGIALQGGEPRFQLQTRGPVVSSGVAVGSRFLIGGTDGDLYLIDATGRVLHQAPLSPAGIQSSAAVDGEELVIGSGEGVHAVRLGP